MTQPAPEQCTPTQGSETSAFQVSAPAINLPKGGGAIRGIGEKFAVNPVTGSGLYRQLAQRMRGYADAQARHIFRDLIDTPADVTVTEREVHVRFHRRAHLPIIIAPGILDSPVQVPWWQDYT